MQTREGHIPAGGQHAVLLVNASALIKRYLGDLAQQHGNTLTHAACASEAIVLALQCKFNLMLIESGLPDLSGVDLVQLLRKLRSTRDLPVVMLVGDGEDQVFEALRGVSGVSCLRKRELAPERLQKIVARLASMPPGVQPRRRSLLVISANRRTGQALAQAASACGYDASLVAEVEEQLADRPKGPPDAVLLHASAAGERNIGLTHSVLSNHALDGVPVVFALGLADQEEISAEIVQRDLSAVVTFPFSRYALRTEVERLCEVREQREALLRMEQVLIKVVNELDLSRDLLLKREEDLAVSQQYRRNLLPKIGLKLREPVTQMLGFVNGALSAEGLPEDLRGALQAILGASRELMCITDGLGNLTDIEQGRTIIKLRHCAPAGIIWKLEEDLGPKAAAAGLDLSVVVQGALPREIETDAERAHQMVVQLVENAIKFTAAGKLRLEIEYERVAGLLSFTVSDTGCGIDAERLPRLFDPPWAYAECDPNPAAGLCMGLPFVKLTAEQLGGSLTVRSRPGKGSCFRLTVAAGAVNEDTIGCDPLLMEGATANQAARCAVEPAKIGGHVLIVEDSVIQQRLFEYYLRKTRIAGVFVQSGREALAQAAAEEYDLVLMDVHLPEMDGYQTARGLREQGYNNPIIAITSGLERRSGRESSAAGCNAALAKPFEAAQFYELLAFYLHDPGDLPAGEAQPADAAGSEAAAPAAGGLEPVLPEVVDIIADVGPMVLEFVDGLQSDLEILEGHRIAARWEELAKAARALSGNAGLFGYRGLAAIAGEVLDAVLAGEPEAIKAVIKELRLELTRVVLGRERLAGLAAEAVPATATAAAPCAPPPAAAAPLEMAKESSPPAAAAAPAAKEEVARQQCAQALLEKLRPEQREHALAYLRAFSVEFKRVQDAYQRKDWRKLAFAANELGGTAALCGLSGLCDLLLKIEQTCYRQEMTRIPPALQAAAAYAAELLSGDSAQSAAPQTAAASEPETKVPPEISVDPPMVSELAEACPDLIPLIKEFVGELAGYLDRMRKAAAAQGWDELKSVAHEAAGAAGMYGYPLYRKAAKDLQGAAEKHAQAAVPALLDQLERMSDQMRRGIE